MSSRTTCGTIALAFGIAGLLGAMTPVSVSADPIADFYKNKRMRIVQGSAPGGGYDMYARTLARHLPKHIPGNPRILVQNKPGAGGIVSANYIYNVAKQDGTKSRSRATCANVMPGSRTRRTASSRSSDVNVRRLL